MVPPNAGLEKLQIGLSCQNLVNRYHSEKMLLNCPPHIELTLRLPSIKCITFIITMPKFVLGKNV